MSKSILSENFKKPEGAIGELIGQHMESEYSALNRWAVGMLNVQEADKILEIGFGTGMAIEALSNCAHNGLVAGLDYSDLMLHQAKKRNEKGVQARRIDLRLGNVSALPDFGVVFDKIIAINNIMYWEKPIDVLWNLRQILKPGGTLSIYWLRELDKIQSGQQDSEIQWYAYCLRQAGFTIKVEIQPLEKQYRPLDSIDGKQLNHSTPFTVAGICITGLNQPIYQTLGEYYTAILGYISCQRQSFRRANTMVMVQDKSFLKQLV